MRRRHTRPRPRRPGAWEFIVGGDWPAAIGVVAALALTALIAGTGAPAWWITPVGSSGCSGSLSGIVVQVQLNARVAVSNLICLLLRRAFGDRPRIGAGPPRYARVVTPEELANLAHLRRARDLIDREYARPLDVPMLARVALMSTAHFSRQFRSAYGETPYSYLMTRRIERAKALLRRGDDLSVTEVCFAVGCSSLGSFSTSFRKLVGATPTAYRAGDHSALATVPGCVARQITRPSRGSSRIGEAREAPAPVGLPHESHSFPLLRAGP